MTAAEIQTQFFKLLFDDDDGIGANRLLLVWTLPAKTSRFFSTIPDAVKYIATLGTQQNVYFGLGLVSHAVLGGRGTKSDMAAITTLWVDVDIQDAAHKKKNLPPDLAAARALVAELDLAPSMIVESGHGLQAYWLLKEPLPTGTPDELAAAERLTTGWVGRLKVLAAAHGWDVDSVGDVTRVFRVPGSTNLKGSSPRPVTLDTVAASPPRYAVDDFRGMVVPELAPDAPRANVDRQKATQTPLLDGQNVSGNGQNVSSAGMTLARDAEPPHTKWEALCENDQKFKRSWLRQRKDLTDQSPSAYDMSLAILAGQVGWTDQEIANLLIAHRRKHGDNLKFDRKDNYYARTIKKARLAIDMQTDDAAAEAIKGAEVDDAAAGGRDAILKSIRGKIKIPLLGVIKRGCPDARYSIVVDADNGPQEVTIGPVGIFLSPNDFGEVVYDATRRLLPGFKKDTWRKIVELMTQIMEEVTIAEGGPREQLMQWIEGYLNDRNVWSGANWAEALIYRDPFVRSGRLYLQLTAFKKSLFMQHGERQEIRNLQSALSSAGFSDGKVTGTPDSTGRRLGRYYWSIETAKVADVLTDDVMQEETAP